MDRILESGFDKQLKEAIKAGILYIGSSAGSIVLGTTLEPAEIFGDEPVTDEPDYHGLGIIDGAIIPHMNQKTDAYNAWLDSWNKKTYILYDGDGIIIDSI